MLARLPEIAPEHRERAARRYLAARNIPNNDAEMLTAGTLGIIDNADFAAAFASGSRAEADIVAELPELGVGARVNGRVDRLSVTDEAVLAIDFKSNRPAPTHISESGAVLYRANGPLSRRSPKIFPDRRVDCALVWTETPLLMSLPPHLLDAELQRVRAAA